MLSEFERIVRNVDTTQWLLFLTTFLVSYLIYAWLICRPKNVFPGSRGIPILGYWPFLGADSPQQLLKLSKKYGDVFGLYLGSKYTVIINEYKAAKEILNNPAALDRERNVLRPLEPMGFGTLNGPQWVEQRRFSFYSARELGFGKGPWETIIVEEALNFAKSLEKLNGVPTDISLSVRQTVASNIVYFLTGRKMDQIADAETIKLILDYASMALRYLGPDRTVSLMPWMWKFMVWFRISEYNKVAKVFNDFKAFLRQEVNRHKTEPELKGAQDIINSYFNKLESTSAVEGPKHYFNEQNLVGMVNSLFLGGSDTIVSSINWVLRIMAVHQDIQAKVYAEIMEVLGTAGIARYEERQTLPYTFAVLMESQRYSTIAPLSNARRANQDFAYNGYTIPKGSAIITNLWAMHNDPNYWDEPEVFRPERFLANDGKTIQKSLPSYAPFSIGRRNCPGETIAWMEILSYFTEIMKRYKVTMAPGVKADFSAFPGLVIHLKPQSMCFTKREG